MGLSQVNQLFDLMELFNQVPSSSAEEMVKNQKAVDSNYLSRGERILTLLREKIKTNPKRFKENSFFESLNFKTYSSYDDEKKLGYVLRKMREVIRPITNRLSEDSDLSELADLMPGFNLIESVKVAGEYERSVMKALLRTTEVDIKKMEELYKQFEDVCKFVGLKMHDEVSLRFRKLGNHKASGLYYFFLKCLCVDVRCPSSFAHEMFHMIDYENGNLSRKAGFYYVSELYKRAFEEEVQKDSVLSKQLGGKTKYNREYYLQSSEIFARCGEIYLTRICGFDNSVVKPDTDQCGFAYPSDELLEQKIKEYFNKLFNKRTNEYRAAV